jgi:SWIM zinc finger
MILGHIRLEARYMEQLALRRKEYGIAVPIDKQLIEHEFPQVAFLDNNQARTTSAERLVSQSKINSLEAVNGMLYVNVESENPVRLSQPYRVCIYGQTATDVRCECLDFLSKGGACKHLRAAAIFINKLRLQAEHQYLPAITFINKHQAFLIRCSLPRTPSCIDVVSQDDKEAEEEIAEELDWPFEDDTGETTADEQQEEITDEGHGEESEHEDGVKNLTGFQDLNIIELEVLSNFTGPRGNIQIDIDVNEHPSIADQNAKAVREQHLTHLHLTTTSFLHQLKTNLRSYQKIKAPETADLISNLENVVNSTPYTEALSQVSQLIPKTKRMAEDTGFYPLDVEKKQRRHQSFTSL